MKKLFFAIFLVLCLLSAAIYFTMPSRQSSIPILYWVTDSNPARKEQIRKFHLWQMDQGHGEQIRIETMEQLGEFRQRAFSPAITEAIIEGNENGPAIYHPKTTAGDLPLVVKVPACEMRTDTASGDRSKKIVQGVSGVAGDIIDAGTNRGEPKFLQDIGMIQPLEEPAARLGFGLDKTWPALTSDLTVIESDGTVRQYAFPCNTTLQMLWVNRETFEKLGMDLPPRRWTLDEFERIGKEFVRRGNEGKEIQDTFFCSDILITPIAWSLGGSVFNETMTRCTLDSPGFVEALRRKYRWIEEDHLMPTRADLQTFATESGYGGARPQLFKNNQLGMIYMGRYILIQFRKFPEPLSLEVVEPPHGGRPVTILGSRAATVYRGSPHKEEAYLFMAFLASESYNRQIVDDADALPPNPAYCETEEFRYPTKFPNEHGTHERFAESVYSIGVTSEWSPFVSPNLAQSMISGMEDRVLSGRGTPVDAAREATDRINLEIQRKLEQNPQLKVLYDKNVERQKIIDRRVKAFRAAEEYRQKGQDIPEDIRKQAKPIPAGWVTNPYWKKVYQEKGWLDSSASAPAR